MLTSAKHWVSILLQAIRMNYLIGNQEELVCSRDNADIHFGNVMEFVNIIKLQQRLVEFSFFSS